MNRKRIISLALLVFTAIVAIGSRTYWQNTPTTPLSAAQVLGTDPDEFAAWVPDKKIDLVAHNTELKDILQLLAKQLGEPVLADWKSLDRISIEPSRRLTIDRSNTPAHRVLAAILYQLHDCVFDRIDNVWTLTSDTDRPLYTRHYDLRWLINPTVTAYDAYVTETAEAESDFFGNTSGGGGSDLFWDDEEPEPVADGAASQIKELTSEYAAYDRWLNVDDSVTMTTYQGVLTVKAPGAAHRRIANLLYDIYLADQFGIDHRDAADTTVTLDQLITIEQTITELKPLLDLLKDEADVVIEFVPQRKHGHWSPDLIRLNLGDKVPVIELVRTAMQVATEQPVTTSIAEAALSPDGRVALGPNNNLAAPNQYTRVYAIGDLIAADPAMGQSHQDYYDIEELREVWAGHVRANVTPEDWIEAGGSRAKLTIFSSTFVIHADRTTHTAIADHFANLRRIRNRPDAPQP